MYFVSINSSLPFDTYAHFKDGEAETQSSEVTSLMFPQSAAGRAGIELGSPALVSRCEAQNHNIVRTGREWGLGIMQSHRRGEEQKLRQNGFGSLPREYSP